MGELPSSAAAAFAVLEGLALDRPAIERRALNADMCDYIEWSKRKVEGQRREKKRQPLSTVGTRKAERRSWRGLYPAICAMWSAESWNVWVPPLSANGMICLLTSSAGSSSTRPRANRTTPPC